MIVLAETIMVLAKFKIPDSCQTFLAVSHEMIWRNYGNLKCD